MAVRARPARESFKFGALVLREYESCLRSSRSGHRQVRSQLDRAGKDFRSLSCFQGISQIRVAEEADLRLAEHMVEGSHLHTWVGRRVCPDHVEFMKRELGK